MRAYLMSKISLDYKTDEGRVTQWVGLNANTMQSLPQRPSEGQEPRLHQTSRDKRRGFSQSTPHSDAWSWPSAPRVAYLL